MGPRRNQLQPFPLANAIALAGLLSIAAAHPASAATALDSACARLDAAALRGDPDASAQLSILYSDKHSLVPTDWQKARMWAERGIEKRHAPAACLRADISASGLGGVPSSWPDYINFMEMAVSFGDHDSAYRLAGNYKNGIPEFTPGQGIVPKDRERYLHFLAIAAAYLPDAQAEWDKYHADAKAAGGM